MNAVKSGLNIGYRHLDTARLYQVEPSVGQGLKLALQSGTVKREDVFVTSKVFGKLWYTPYINCVVLVGYIVSRTSGPCKG